MTEAEWADMERLLPTLETREVAAQSWKDNGAIYLADSIDEAIAISNDIAPEHLEVQVENERDLHAIQSVFASKQAPAVSAGQKEERRRKHLQYTLSQLGMAGEKGAKDIVDMCLLLMDRGEQASQVGVGALCAQLSENPKSMEQRARRAVERGLFHIASLGVEDYGNEIFSYYAARLFPFQAVRAEMAYIQGRGERGKANLKHFLDGMLAVADEG